MIPLLLLSAWLSACRNPSAPTAPPPPPVNVVQPVARTVQDFEEFVARVAAINSVEVRPRVTGYIQEVYFNDGDVVKEGQLLVLIDPRTFQAAVDRAQASLNEAKANEAYAQRDYQRYQEAARSGVATTTETDLAASRLQVTRATVQASEAALRDAQVQLTYTKVMAPISGRISRIQVTRGNLVTGENVLTSIVSITPIYVYFDVDERKLNQCRDMVCQFGANGAHIEDARLPLYASMASGEQFTRRGHVDFVDNRINPQTGTMQFRGVFPNEDAALIPGAFARVRMPSSQPHQALLVPDKAVGQDQDRRFLIVVGEDGSTDRRLVTLGRSYGPWRVVEKGLAPGEWIVSEGLLRVRPGEKVTPMRQPPPDLPKDLPAGIPVTPIDLFRPATQTAPATRPPPATAPTPATSATRPAATSGLRSSVPGRREA